MRCFWIAPVVSVCLCVSSLAGTPAANAADPTSSHSSSKTAKQGSDSLAEQAFARQYGALPLSFEANQGQSDGQVRFLSRGSGYSLFLTRDGALLTFAPDSHSQTAVFQMQLSGANPQAQVRGVDELPGKNNYFFGNDSRRWRTAVPTYSKVAYQNIYPGINLVYYGTQRQLEYDFVLAPGADPKQIQLTVSGAEKISVEANGNLILHSASDDVQLLAPNVYQQYQGQKHQVAGQWFLTASNTAGFRIGAYDRSKPLVIDPVLQYSSFLGGSKKNALTRIAIDTAGNAYVAGYTASGNFPAAPTPQATTFGNGTPSRGAFVAKIDPTGSTLLYSTYLSGSVDEEATGLAIDATGNVYVAGTTHSPDFPTHNAFQTTCATHTQAGSCSSAFLTQISPSGDMLLFSTYLGGSGGESARGLAIDPTGSAYVLGVTSSLDFPVTAGAAQTKCTASCEQNAFLAKFSPIGDKLVYATYLGGSGVDDSAAIAVDSSGNAYITGHTTSPDFPAVSAYQKSCAPDSLSSSGACVVTAFLTKLKADGSAFAFSTYLGGALGSQSADVAVDSMGSAYVTGSTVSSDFPVVKPYQKSCAKDAVSGLCSLDAFVTKFAPSGKTLVYSTYLGGSGRDEATGIALDASGNAHIIGRTESANFPSVAAAQKNLSGQSDAFVARLNAAGDTLSFSTYHGGSALESGNGIAVDGKGNVYITGQTSSPDFPTLHPFQSSCAGTCANAFVSKMALPPPPGVTASTTVVTTSKTPTVFGESVTFTATVTGGSGTPTGTVDFLDGTTSLGTVTLDGTGTATLTTSTLAAGPHTINGNYGGDTTYATSSGNVTQVVDPASTTTTVTAVPATSSTFGESVTFTAAISVVAPGAGTPAGTVDFTQAGNALSGCTAVTVTGGKADCTTTSLDAAPYTIKATYNPTGGDFATSNGTLPYTVNPAATTTALTAAPPNTAAVNQSVTFTATITAVAPGSGTPVGTVAFTDPTNPLAGCAAASLNGGGVATCTISTLAAGSYTIKATYNPTGGNFTTSNLSIPYIIASPPTISKAFANPTVVLNNSVDMTITITNPNSGIAMNGVTFNDPLPSGLVVGPAGLVSNSCQGTPSATAGTSSVSLTGGKIAAGGSCTLVANIKGITAGTSNNTTGAVSSNEGGTGLPSNTASLTVQNFTWVISSAAATVIQGTSTAAAVVGSSPTATSTPVSGFSDTVTVTTPCVVSPATATITCTPNPATIAGGNGSSVVTINTTGTTPVGVYAVTIEGVDQAPAVPLHHSQTFTLTVECTWNVSPATQTVNADASTGGKYSIALSLTGGQQCPWAATSAPWISLASSSGTTGAGGSTVQFDVSSFYGAAAIAPRNGSINLDFTNGSAVTTGFTQPTGTSSVTQNEVVMTSIAPASPPSVHVNSGTTIQFTTTPANTANPNLLWTVTSTSCGSGACGSITSSANVTGTYTAPANISTSAAPHTSASDTVDAASQADPTKLAISPLPSVSILNDPPTCAGAPGILAAPAAISGADPINNPVVIQFNHTCTDNLDNENDLNSDTVNYGDSSVSQVTSFATTGSQAITQQYQYGQNASFAPGTTYVIAETPSDTSIATGANTQAAYLTITYRASDSGSMHVTANGSNTQVLTNSLSNQDIQTFFLASGSDPCVPATNGNGITVSGIIKSDGTTDANNFGITCSLSTAGAPWTLTVSTTAATNPGTSRLTSSRMSPVLVAASLFGFPAIVIVGFSMSGKRKTRLRVLTLFTGLVLLLSLLIFTPSCGGGIHATFINSGTKDVLYFLTVSGTDNNGAQQTYIVPVTVAPAQ